MRPRPRLIRFFTALIAALAICLAPARAADIGIATASNFLNTLHKLAADFERKHPEHHLRISAGSTGKLYAQILHGAPYDVFLSADRERPEELHQQGLADAPVTYAIGRLVLYAPQGEPRVRLDRGEFKHLAIANPTTAPYGAAARSVLETMRLWETLQPRLVIGENIGQAFQFVHSGNAELGFVALAQVRAAAVPQQTWWELPADSKGSLEQQAVLLKRSRVPQAATDFMTYLGGDSAREIIDADGYGLPGASSD